jgi:integrase
VTLRYMLLSGSIHRTLTSKAEVNRVSLLHLGRRNALMRSMEQAVRSKSIEWNELRLGGDGSTATSEESADKQEDERTRSVFVEVRILLAANGIECGEALVPKSSDGKADYWTDGMWGNVEAMVAQLTGIKFRIQELRATFGQMCGDGGGRIEDVSRALRHRITRTTKLYYVRVRSKQAFKALESLFFEYELPADRQISNNPELKRSQL